MIQSSSREGKCSRTIAGLKAALVLLTGQQIVKAVDRYRVNLQSIGIGFIFSGGVVELFGFLWAVPALGVREGALWIFRYYGVTFFSRISLEGTFVGLGCRFGGCGGPIVVCTVVGCIFFHYIAIGIVGKPAMIVVSPTRLSTFEDPNPLNSL